MKNFSNINKEIYLIKKLYKFTKRGKYSVVIQTNFSFRVELEDFKVKDLNVQITTEHRFRKLV